MCLLLWLFDISCTCTYIHVYIFLLQSNPERSSKYGVSFACFCPAFSDTAMVTGVLSAEDPPEVVDFVKNRQAIMALINGMGINT